MNFADRMSRLGTESAFEVLARARALERQGKEIVHLEIGEPDFDTPVHIRDAAKRALDDGRHALRAAAGLPELREAIAKDVGGDAQHPGDARGDRRHAGREANHVLRHHGARQSRATR